MRGLYGGSDPQKQYDHVVSGGKEKRASVT